MQCLRCSLRNIYCQALGEMGSRLDGRGVEKYTCICGSAVLRGVVCGSSCFGLLVLRGSPKPKHKQANKPSISDHQRPDEQQKPQGVVV